MPNNHYLHPRPNNQKTRHLAIPIVLVLAGLIWLTAPVQPSQAAPPAQTPDSAPSVSGGQSLWTENCLPCHGSTGQGDGPTAQSIPNPLPNFADAASARQYVPLENFDVIKNGRMDMMMPPWRNQLSDAEIWDAVAYVWRLGTSPQTLSTGETVYTEQCAACHGDNGTGDGIDAPASINNFTDLETMVQKSQVDLQAAYQASDQHADLDALTEADLWASLDYVRTFSYDLPVRDGVLVGQVLNAATNQPVGNVEVRLHAFQDNTRLETLTVQADQSGNYRFEDLATDHSIIYIVEGFYEEVDYISQESGMFMPDSTEATLNLEVYDTTSSDAAINVTQLHYLLSFNPGVVSAMQIYIVGNEGDKTYIGQNGQTFAFDLPANAVNVNFQNNLENQRFVETETGYTDTEPVLPGEEGLSIAAIYDIPMTGDSATIELPLPANVDALDVLMTEQGATLSSDQVEFVENRDFQGNSFAVYRAANLSKGDTVTLQLSNLSNLTFEAPAAGEVSAVETFSTTTWFDQELAKWIIVGLGLVAIVVVGVVYPVARPQSSRQPELQEEDSNVRRQKLLLTLARLDEAFENGELEDRVYQRARAKYKAELAELMELA